MQLVVESLSSNNRASKKQYAGLSWKDVIGKEY